MTRSQATGGGDPVQQDEATSASFGVLDSATVGLVRAAAVLAAGSEDETRAALTASLGVVPAVWMEELILQTYLFAGFPRALNAMREWRRLSGVPAPAHDEADGPEGAGAWRTRGEETCAAVYGRFYAPLRHNIRELHPALDAWMVVDGYGKVLSRPALDLVRRELCIVAACAAARQDRQLHSHLHGALHVGATPAAVGATLDAIADLLDAKDLAGYRGLWARVKGR